MPERTGSFFQIEFVEPGHDPGEMPHNSIVKAPTKDAAVSKFRTYMKQNFPGRRFQIKAINKVSYSVRRVSG